MLRTIFRLSAPLGARGFYPVPSWMRPFFSRLSPTRQMVTYARLMKGVDLSFLAPDELGCQEAVSRIWYELFGDPIKTGTWHGLEYLITSPKWLEIRTPVDGCVVIAATGTGVRGSIGHVGIYDSKRVWSNRSDTGKWDNYYSHLAFLDRYRGRQQMAVRYFIRLKK